MYVTLRVCCNVNCRRSVTVLLEKLAEKDLPSQRKSNETDPSRMEMRRKRADNKPKEKAKTKC